MPLTNYSSKMAHQIQFRRMEIEHYYISCIITHFGFNGGTLFEFSSIEALSVGGIMDSMFILGGWLLRGSY